jgi:SAM-dependent methyltransferase
MNFLDLKDISERYMEWINPVSPEKIALAGKMAGLAPGMRLIDFGCGFGAALALWAEQHGISGVGIDIRPYACQRARAKVAERGLEERIEITQGKGAEYQFESHSFDVAACIGATFIWGGYAQALQALKAAIRPGGKILVGEAYWAKDSVPPAIAREQVAILPETQLLQLTRQAGLDVAYVVRASQDDWDRYEASNWHGLLRWIEANPDHAERQQVIDHLHASQDEYFRYGREYFGWALYLLDPIQYR